MMRKWRLWRLRRHRARLAELSINGDPYGIIKIVKGRIAWHESLIGVAGMPQATVRPKAPAASEIKKPPPRSR